MRRSRGKINKVLLFKIRDCLVNGDSNKLICYNYKITEKLLFEIYGDFIKELEQAKINKHNSILGHQDDTFSEEELLEFPNYSWKTLSQNEKNFYERRNTRTYKARNPGEISRHYSENKSLE